jgi:thromboxane-A synthase/cytochrome P450 family 3 subfamily A
MHTDPENYPRPFQLLPERWYPTDAPENARPLRFGAFNVFGGGPKMCIGHRVAVLQVKVLVARLAQVVACFRLAPAAPAVTPITAVTTSPAAGVWVVAELQ